MTIEPISQPEIHTQPSGQAMMQRQVAVYPPIVIRGLPNSGKTTLANVVVQTLRARRIQTIHLNADAIRASLNSDLGFDPNSRSENARRIGAMALLSLDNGITPVIDFVMPTLETLNSFRIGIQNRPYALWCVQRESDFRSRFADTQAMFQNTFGYPVCFKMADLQGAADNIIQGTSELAARQAEIM
jgi:adenylylsulfate kinase-like enzyme